MKTLAIIGSNGTLGSDLVKYLDPNFKVTSITKENYQLHLGKTFDILINANGNSKRFWANQNPEDDFFASTVSVYESIFDFNCDSYVYISSPDVYVNHEDPKFTKENEKIEPNNLEPYGFHKYLSELIVKKYREKFLILRLAMILGENLKKGPFYDVITNNPLRVSLDTKLQLITTSAIAEIVEILLEKFLANETLNIGGIGAFPFTKIEKYFDKEIQISNKAKTQIYEMNIEKVRKIYPKLKTSEDYLKNFLKHP